jgi:ribosomal protein S6-L-glutamate ligase RimK-like protein
MAFTGRGTHGHRIAVFYEHPEWFKPLFAELDRRGVAYDRLLAHEHRYDPTDGRCPYDLVVNRMSPSAYTRGHTQAIFYTLQYMAHLKEIGANVLHGYDTYVYEFSKARQIGLLHRLGLRHPRARVINHPSQAPAAAEGLMFPVILKPNIGGSGAKIVRFETPEALRAAALAGTMDLGIDGTALVQEYLPAEGSSIVRVEVLNGAFLYAIRLFLTANEFNLCPADYCRVPANAGQPEIAGLADGVSGRGVPVEDYTPPPQVVRDVLRITQAAQIEVGGVEYLVNSRDGQVHYYDINALSNFVADAPRVIGFDPFPGLVEFLLQRAGLTSTVTV